MALGNFLASLTGANGIPRKIPMIDPTTGLPIEEPVITSAAMQLPQQAMAPAQPVIEQAPPPAPVPEMPVSNVMQPANLLEGTPYADMAMPKAGEQAPMYSQPAPEAAPAQQSPQRERRSLLDTIGRISDVIARVGGAEALYQPTLDAAQDRLRQIDLEEMQKQLLEQQVQAGQGTLADTARGRLAQALGAIAGNPRAAELWPQVAEQAGIDPQQAEAIGVRIQNDPEYAATSARALGWAPPAAPSMAKELQIYDLIQREGTPEELALFRQSLVNPDALSPYQKAQLEISLANLGLSRDKFEQDVYESDREFESKQGSDGGIDLTPKQRGDVRMKLELMPVAKQQFSRVRELYNEMVKDGTFARGAVGGLLPGQVVGGKAEEFDKAIGALRKSILAMTRVPGVGSMSNYETMLDEAALPSRWGSDEGRAEAINNIGMLLDNYESGYQAMLGNPEPAPPPPARRRGGSQRIMPRYKPGSSQGDLRSQAEAEARRRGLIQ